MKNVQRYAKERCYRKLQKTSENNEKLKSNGKYFLAKTNGHINRINDNRALLQIFKRPIFRYLKFQLRFVDPKNRFL